MKQKIDFSSLNEYQINNLIDKLCFKLENIESSNLNNFCNFLCEYRKIRYNGSLINIADIDINTKNAKLYVLKLKNIKTEIKKENIKEENKSHKNTSHKNKEIDFEYMATHDQLTGLKNLMALDLAKNDCETKNVVILFFDVNDLKLTNDTLGHAVGNKLITTTANTLNELFPEVSYRIGGDEFLVFFEYKNIQTIETEINNKIKVFKDIMSEKARNDEDGLKYSVSVGFSIGDGIKEISEIQEEADQAMYENKRAFKEKRKKEQERNNEEKSIRQEVIIPSNRKLAKNINDINKLRIRDIDQNSDCLDKNNNILNRDNIKQIESNVSLSEINELLPQESLFNKYLFNDKEEKKEVVSEFYNFNTGKRK